MGAANEGFFWVKEQQRLNHGVPLTLGFFLASAGWEVAIGFTHRHLLNKSESMAGPFTKMLEL
jgi:hypothetical protein